MADLSHKVALVTGSSSGIGESTARLLADSGANVIVNSSSSVEAGMAVADSLPTEAIYHQADISSKSDCRSLLDVTIERFGRLDILVNNAGWTKPVAHGDLDALTDEIFQRTFDVNVFGTWWLTKMAMTHLADSPDGNVVIITSVAGLRPIGSSIAYSMSKAALNHMTVLLAKSMGPVRVNAVAPGLVETPWTGGMPELREAVAKQAPMGRSATSEEIAQAVLALAANNYITGEVLVVDGGLTSVM